MQRRFTVLFVFFYRSQFSRFWCSWNIWWTVGVLYWILQFALSAFFRSVWGLRSRTPGAAGLWGQGGAGAPDLRCFGTGWFLFRRYRTAQKHSPSWERFHGYRCLGYRVSLSSSQQTYEMLQRLNASLWFVIFLHWRRNIKLFADGAISFAVFNFCSLYRQLKKVSFVWLAYFLTSKTSLGHTYIFSGAQHTSNGAVPVSRGIPWTITAHGKSQQWEEMNLTVCLEGWDVMMCQSDHDQGGCLM